MGDIRQEWLDSLHVGDEVVVTNRYRTYVAKIDRITPTRQIKVGGITFDSKGRERAPWIVGVLAPYERPPLQW